MDISTIALGDPLEELTTPSSHEEQPGPTTLESLLTITQQ